MSEHQHTAVLVVFTNPSEGADETAFHDWYDNVHIPEVKERVSGICCARRFALPEGAQGPGRFLAVYDLTEPATKVQADLFAAAPGFTRSDVISRDMVLAAYDAR